MDTVQLEMHLRWHFAVFCCTTMM